MIKNNMCLIGLVACVFIIGCSERGNDSENNKAESNGTVSRQIDYPQIIDSLGLQKQYDEGKWLMYCMFCDDTAKVYYPAKDRSKTFGSLDLRLDDVVVKHDSIELNFYFYLNDTLRCDSRSIENFYISNGLVFKQDSVLCLISPTTLRYFKTNNPKSRFVNPLQPEVLEFINKNKGTLNPWFREAAIKRKLIS